MFLKNSPSDIQKISKKARRGNIRLATDLGDCVANNEGCNNPEM